MELVTVYKDMVAERDKFKVSCKSQKDNQIWFKALLCMEALVVQNWELNTNLF